MPDLKAGLYSFLTGNSTITDQVGTRIYPTIAPASAIYPYAVYTRIGFQEHAGVNQQTGLYEEPLQIDIWGSSSLQVDTAFRAFQSVLDGYQGVWGTIDVRDARITSVLDSFEAPSEGLEDGEYRTIINMDVWYK